MTGALGLVTFTCGHSVPQRGRDRTARIACGSCRYVEIAIGPRVVGGRYHCGYWNDDYTVLDIARGDRFIGGWNIVVQWSDGHRTSHATAWEPRRDRVLEEQA